MKLFAAAAIVSVSCLLPVTGVMAQDRVEERVPTIEDYVSYYLPKFASDGLKDAMEKGEVERQKTILSVNALLERKISDVDAVLLRRQLGELYTAQYVHQRKVTTKKYLEAFKQWEVSGRRGEQPQLKHDTSDIINAANVYRDIVNKSPKHLVKEEDMFNLVLSLARAGSESTPQYFKMMTQRFPDAKLSPYAKMALGEYYFSRREWSLATPQYSELSEKKNSPLCAYAFYKIGWIHFAQRELDKSNSEMHAKKAVVALRLAAKLLEKNNQTGGYDLKEEMMKDLSLFWAVSKDVATAKDYFEQQKRREFYFSTLDKLAKIYGDEGNYQKAIAMTEELVRENATNPENPRRYLTIVQYRESSGVDPMFVASDLEQMKNLFYGSTAWTRANSENPSMIKEAAELLEKVLASYGTVYHKEGIAGKKQYSAAAVRIYELYVKTFPKSDKTYDFRFYLASLLTQLNRMDEAANQFLAVTEAAPKDGKHLKEAAFNAVACMNEVVNSKKFPEVPPVLSIAKPIDLPAEKAKFVKMMDNYATLLPNDPQSVSMRYFAADTLFQYGRFSEALPRYREIVFKSPATEQAAVASQQSLEYYKAKRLYPEGIAFAKEVTDAKLALPKETMQYVVGTYKYLVFQWGESLESQKKFGEAGERFSQFRALFPRDENADLALERAMQAYLAAGQLHKVVETASVILKDYKNSAYRLDALWFTANAQERMAMFQAAAERYDEFAVNFPADARAAEAMSKGGRLYGISGKDDAMINLLSRLVQAHADRAEAGDYFELGKALEDKKRFADARSIYEKLIGSSKRKMEDQHFAEAKIAESYWKEANKEKARSLASALIGKTSPSSLKARKVAASVLFALAESDRDSLNRLEVRAGNPFKTDLAAIQKGVAELTQQYENVAKIGVVEFSLGSLFRMGEIRDVASEKLAATLGSATGEAKLKMAADADKLMLPWKAEAERYYELGQKLGKKSNAFTAWTGRVYDKLAVARPEKYPRVDEMSQDPTYFNLSVKSNSKVAMLFEEQ